MMGKPPRTSKPMPMPHMATELLTACLIAILIGGQTSSAVHVDVSAPAGQPGVSPESDPDFTSPIQNVTVAVGREAILTCPVTDLGFYKLGWMKVDDQTILTVHNRVVTHNARISVTNDNERTWQLRIRQVKETDRGCYMCQINTVTMKKQIGCVDVQVPPDINDEETSSDVTVQEGENATIICRATGHPTPRILWRREDGEHMVLRKNREILKVDTYSGDTLTLLKLDRKQMGAYLCIASNDVPPAVSKRITLNVNFAPVIRVPNHVLGAPLGTDVQIECNVEAYPNTINYWVKNRGEMILDGKRYIISEERTGYKVHLSLVIKNYSKKDLGTYMCVATNSLGKAEGSIRLYEIVVQTTPPPPTTTTTTTTMRILTLPVTEPTTRAPEPIMQQRSAVIATTTIPAPVEALLEPSVDKSVHPTISTLPHQEYIENYFSSTTRLGGSTSAVMAAVLLLVLR